jgi:uncharacterized protein
MEDNNLNSNLYSFPEANKRNIPFSTISSGFGLFGLFIAATLVVAIPLAIATNLLSPSYKPLLNFLGYTVSMALLLFIAVKIRKNYFFLWGKVPVIVFLFAVLIILSMEIIMEPFTSLIPMPVWIQKLFEDMLSHDIFTFLMVVIAAPFLEELVFRGVLLDGLLKRYSPQKAIIWSSLFFGLVHMNPWQFIGAFLASLVLGWVYWKTKSLWPGIVMHMVNNLLGFLILVYSDTSSITFQVLGSNSIIRCIYFLSIPVLILGLWAMKNELNKKV